MTAGDVTSMHRAGLSPLPCRSYCRPLPCRSDRGGQPQDLYAGLDGRVLRRLWALLWLPARLRKSREPGFPVLAELRSPVKGDAGGQWWR